jgi:hypothetical protein
VPTPVSTPSPVPAPAPTQPSAPTPTAGTASVSAQPAPAASGPRATPRRRTASAKQEPAAEKTVFRFANRGPDRNAIRLVFTLRRAAKLELVVKGPGPGCEVAARLPVTGRKGENRFRFGGRPYGHPLPFGTYALELRVKATGASLGDVLAGIVRPGVFQATIPPAPRCESAAPQQPSSTSVLASGPTASPPAAPPPEPAPAPRADRSASEVLAQVKSEERDLPLAGAVEAAGDGGHGFLERILLGIILASLLALAVLVAGSLRRGRPQY